VTDYTESHKELHELWQRADAGEDVSPVAIDAAFKLGQARTAQPAPPATESPTQPTERTSVAANPRAQEAFAASVRSKERASLVNAARELLREEMGSHVDVDSLTEQETLQLAGIEKTKEQKRAEEEARILSDPDAYQEWERSRALKRLDSRWFQLTRSEQKTESARLGIDWDAARAAKLKEMRAATPDARPAESEEN
jgi:hypothetical protein